MVWIPIEVYDQFMEGTSSFETFSQSVHNYMQWKLFDEKIKLLHVGMKYYIKDFGQGWGAKEVVYSMKDNNDD